MTTMRSLIIAIQLPFSACLQFIHDDPEDDVDFDLDWFRPQVVQRDANGDTTWGSFPCGNMHSGRWKPDASRTGSANGNICIQSKQLPDLFLLGAKKSATTSLAADIVSSNMTCYQGYKESSFYTHNMKNLDESQALERLLQHAPACNRAAREVITDMTPDYLAMVPPWQEMDIAKGFKSLPLLLKTIYGESTKKITFIIILREPLSRMQSHYYFNQRQATEPSFGRYLDKVLQSSDELTEFERHEFWYSHYGAQLEDWLKYFDAYRFVVVPDKVYYERPGLTCDKITKLTGYPMDCNITLDPERCINCGSSHPSLEEDTTEEQRSQFSALMKNDTKRLHAALAGAASRGASLVGFKGEVFDEGAIRKWLRRSW